MNPAKAQARLAESSTCILKDQKAESQKNLNEPTDQILQKPPLNANNRQGLRTANEGSRKPLLSRSGHRYSRPNYLGGTEQISNPYSDSKNENQLSFRNPARTSRPDPFGRKYTSPLIRGLNTAQNSRQPVLMPSKTVGRNTLGNITTTHTKASFGALFSAKSRVNNLVDPSVFSPQKTEEQEDQVLDLINKVQMFKLAVTKVKEGYACKRNQKEDVFKLAEGNSAASQAFS